MEVCIILSIILTTVTRTLRQLWPYHWMGFGLTCIVPADRRFLCWICHFHLLDQSVKEHHSGRRRPGPRLCCRFWDWYYRHLPANLRERECLRPFFLCTTKFSWLSIYLNSSKTLKLMMGQLKISPSIDTFWGLLAPGLATRKSGTCVCPSISRL